MKPGLGVTVTLSSTAFKEHTPAVQGVADLAGVLVLVLVGVLVEVRYVPMAMIVAGLDVFVFVAVIEGKVDGVKVLLGSMKEVCDGLGVLETNGVLVSVGKGGTFVQVGGNWKGVSVEVGMTGVAGMTIGRMPTGNI